MSETRAIARGTADDRELIAAIANGDLEALGGLFDRHEAAVRRHVGRLGVGAADADDLVQAAFLEVVRAASRFDPSLPARGWLLGIATMMVRRHRRSVARALAKVASWATLARPEPAPTPVDTLGAGEETRLFRAALERLSPKKREVFVLVVLEELSGEDAARALGIPVNTVWTRLHHARQELRAALGREQRGGGR